MAQNNSEFSKDPFVMPEKKKWMRALGVKEGGSWQSPEMVF